MKKNRVEIKLSEIRKAKKIKQGFIAETLGVSHVTVCRWEKGDSEPSIFHVKELCRILDCTSDELLGLK